MQFPPELESSAFRTSGGEFAWRRPDAMQATRALAHAGFAILGGELWLIRGGEIFGVLPQHSGPPAVYHWVCERSPSEAWLSFVARSCRESLSAIASLPAEGEVDAPPGAEVFYNLTWAGEF